MKIAHIVPSFHPAGAYGGPPESTYQLALHVATAGAYVRVLTTNANGLDRVLKVETSNEIELAPRLSVRYCKRDLHNSTSLALARSLSDYIAWADVVHLTAVYNFPTIPALALCAAAKKPVVWSPRGALQRWNGVRKPFLKSAFEAICRRVSGAQIVLHLTSESERAQSVTRMQRVGAVIIPNGVHVPRSVARAKDGYDASRGRALRLAYLGRLHPIKGLDNLLDACARFDAHADRPWSLTIAGAGDDLYEKKLARMTDELGLRGKVRFVGDVRGDIKERFFAEHDLLVAPSHTENFGLSIAEALAHGVPVIAGRGTPWSRLEEHGAGLWVSIDPPTLEAALKRASSMPLAAMGERGRAWMTNEYSWQRIAEEMLSVYEQLLRASRGDIDAIERTASDDAPTRLRAR